jgi:Bacterial SH3 domain
MSARATIAPPLSALALSLAAAVFAPPLAAAIEADHGKTNPTTTVRDTNLRKAPGTDSEILTLMPMGVRIEIGECRDGWCRVTWKGQDGFAVARNLAWAAPWTTAFAAWLPPKYQPRQKVKIGDAHQEGPAEHSWILELGAAGEWPLNGERANFGGTIAAEIEPIEDWLELEFGVSSLATTGHTELSGDLLFKKPFRLSRTVEFMIGAGPSFSRTFNGSESGNSWSAEFALDWMFWPTKDIGWFVEPTWSINPKNGQQTVAVSLGLLLGFHK